MKKLTEALYTLYLNIVRKVPVGYTLNRVTGRIAKSTTPTWRQGRGYALDRKRNKIVVR